MSGVNTAYSMHSLTKRHPRLIISKHTLICNPLPISRRSNGDCQIGSSPGSGSQLPQTFPGFSSQWYFFGFTPHYSGGTAPAFHRSSLLSPEGHLTLCIELSLGKCKIKKLLTMCRSEYSTAGAIQQKTAISYYSAYVSTLRTVITSPSLVGQTAIVR